MRTQGRLQLALAGWLVLGVLAGCAKNDQGNATERSHQSPGTLPISSTRANDIICTAARVRGILDQFAKAVSDGNKDAVMQFFDRSLIAYRDYGIEDGKTTDRTVYKVERLADHFVLRFSQHEQLRLETLQINTHIEPPTRGVDFGMEIYRKADDLAVYLGPNGNVLIGKGMLDCLEQKIRVLSFGAIREQTPSTVSSPPAPSVQTDDTRIKPIVIKFVVEVDGHTYEAPGPTVRGELPARLSKSGHILLRASVDHADSVRFLARTLADNRRPALILGPVPSPNGFAEMQWDIPDPNEVYIIWAQAVKRPIPPDQGEYSVDGAGNWVDSSGAVEVRHDTK